jgi:hypothetical protein
VNEDMVDVAAEMADFVEDDLPSKTAIPQDVGDAEAVHAVQKQYADAGFECDGATALAVVREAR